MAEYIERAIRFFTDKGVTRGVAIAYLVVTALIAVMAIVALVLRIIVVVKYHDANNLTTKSGKSCMDVAREALDREGMKDVKVKRAGWLRAFFFGNSYSLSKKTIFLRKSIAGRSSVTAVGVAIQKVAVAKLINSGDKKTVVRNKAQVISLVGPILFIPFVLLGAIVDFLIFGAFGTFSIVAIAISFAVMIGGLVATLLNLPVEKQANEMALDMIEKNNLLEQNEIAAVKKVYDAYLVAYISEFIIAVLRVVQIVLEVVMNVQISNSNN